MYRQLLRVCGNREDAEDVLVEALTRAYKNIDKLEDPERFRAWLATIGRHVCGRVKRKDALAPILRLDDVSEPFVIDDVDANLLQQQLRDAVGKLPVGLREVYRLRDIEGLSGEETSGRLGISLTAMKSRLHRARAYVRCMVDDCVGAA